MTDAAPWDTEVVAIVTDGDLLITAAALHYAAANLAGFRAMIRNDSDGGEWVDRIPDLVLMRCLRMAHARLTPGCDDTLGAS